MTPPKPFLTDGCSGFMSLFWRIVLRHPPPWEGCCIEHDWKYWAGGPNSARLAADIELMKCVAANGHPHWAVLMFIGVRLGGMWWLPFPAIWKDDSGWHFSLNQVRWGYGTGYWEDVRKHWRAR